MFRHRAREQEEDALMKLIFAAVATLTLSAALSGCIVTPVGYGAVVAEAPPVAPYEAVVGVAPGPGYFWMGGGYGWVGGRYVWESGRWAAPRPGYRWSPHAWRRSGNGWRDYGGRWERAR
jgi:hypothetical protein